MHPLQIRRYDPRHVEAAQSMQRNFKEIMEAIWVSILPDLQGMHARGVRPLSAIAADLQWLRFGPAAELSLPGECRRG